jgi:RNA polymerase sigma-70 factor (ECF subfamily)
LDIISFFKVKLRKPIKKSQATLFNFERSNTTEKQGLHRMGFDDQINSDKQLVQRCLNGEISAFRELYDQHKEGLFNVAMRIHHNFQDAEDTLQETFVKIYKALPGFKGESKLSTWIYKILLNTCFSSLKQKKSFAERIINLSKDELVNSTEQNENPANKLILEQEIASLPVGYRSVFVLHEVEGFSHEEIAEMLEITIGTSKSQLFKAKRMLQKRLKPYL